MVKKALSLALAAIAGCVALVPQGTIPSVLSGTEASSQPTGVVGTSGSSSTPTNQPTEPKTPSPSATAGQSQQPAQSATPDASTSPSSGATPAPSPDSTSPSPIQTPTPASTSTSVPYATAVSIVEYGSTTVLNGTAVVLHVPKGKTGIAATWFRFDAIVTMSDGSKNKSVTWSSSDNGIVLAHQGSYGGVVEAVSAGTASITAISADGKASADVSVHVQSGGKLEVEVE